MATLADVRSQNWQISTQALGDIVQGWEDIKQCIDVLLTTQKGTDPFRPNFGVDIYSYIDTPTNEALPALVLDVQQQIELWETRVRITELRTNLDVSTITLQVYWESALGTGQNTATYGTSA